MELIKKEIIIKETKTLFVLVGESIDNNKFLSKCVIKNDLIVVNIDNKKMSDFSDKMQKIDNQVNYDELNAKFKSDIIDLMFYGPLRSEFYCLQVATGIQDYFKDYNFIQIFSSKLIPIYNVTNIELKNFRNILVESRFKSISNFNNSEDLTFSAIDKMGTLNFNRICLKSDSRIEELSELIYSLVKRNGKPHEVFTLGTSLALSKEFISVDQDHKILSPWNFRDTQKGKKLFLDSSYFNKIGFSWGTKSPTDISGEEFIEIIKILDFNIKECLNSSYYDIDVLAKLKWSNTVRSLIIGRYLLDSQSNDSFINIEDFIQWALSSGHRVTSLNRLEEVIYLSRIDVQSSYPSSSSNFKYDFDIWLNHFGINEISLEDKYEFITKIVKKTNNNKKNNRKNKSSHGINIIGYQNFELGLGKAARQYRKILNNLEIETSDLNLNGSMSKKIDSKQILTEVLPFDKNLVIIGADQIPQIAKLSVNDWNLSRYNIGAIFWETDRIPLKIANSLSVFDEFIVSSKYIANNLRKITDKKISVVGLPIANRIDFNKENITKDNLTLYFNFDYLSDIYRKNTFTLIDYVQQKNANSKNMINLIIKSINGRFFPLEQAYLSELASRDENVRLMDKFMNEQDYQNLLEEVDVYVSLHRSEGFGLGLAEAMKLGIPTMATSYSGNLDFMNSDNSYLVDFNLEPISNSRRSPYCQFGGMWAQPKFESFSQQFDNYLSKPEDRILKIAKAKKTIDDEFSEMSVNDKMKKVLRSSGII
jgi:glycosyltransferase involved in cell wall biosynthesis